MVTTADKKKRITLSQAKPGDTFDVQQNAPGIFTLRLMQPVKARPNKVRLEKRGIHTVMVIGRPITREEIQKEIEEWP